MTRVKRKSLLLFLTATFALSAGASIATFSNDQNVVLAESVNVIPDKTAASTEFYMAEGAGVNVQGSGLIGIRFASTITQGYWEKLNEEYEDATFTFYSVVTDGKTGIKKEFGTTTPTFTNGVHEFYSAITYNVNEWTDAKKLEAYALELEANTYVDVKVGESITTIAAAGETGMRSMRTVANGLYINQTINNKENEWYKDEALKVYFEEGNRSEEVWGGFDSTGAGVVNVPGLPDSITEVSAYYGAEKLTASVSNGVVSFSGIDVADDMTVGEENYLSVFTGNKVYSCKVVYATALLDCTNIPTLKEATDGYYVLKDDINMTGITYAANSKIFTGTFNGVGFEISNLTIGNSSGLFYQVAGATIKNLAITNAIITGNQSGVLANAFMPTDGADINTTIENVFISATLSDEDDDTDYSGGIAGVSSFSGCDLNNVVINLNALKNNDCGFVAGFSRWSINATNCYFIGGNGQITGYRANFLPTVNGTKISTEAGLKYSNATNNVNVYDDINAFNTDFSGLTLTKEISAWCAEYFTSTPTQGSIE